MLFLSIKIIFAHYISNTFYIYSIEMSGYKNIIAALMLAMFPLLSSAAADPALEGEEQREEEFESRSFIMGHIADTHSFHLWEKNGHGVSIPLPVILWAEKGPVAFLSSEFHHDDSGKTVVEKNGGRFVIYKEKIYYASQQPNENGQYLEMEGDTVLNEAPLDFSITKNVLMLICSVTILLWVALSAGRFYRNKDNVDKAPRGAAKVLEPIVEFIRDEVARPNIGEKHTDRYMPYLLSLFFFIFLSNLLGLIPIFPFGANLSGNIAFTMVLAVFTFVVVQLSGTRHYWQEIFANPEVPKWLLVLMSPIEFLGLFTKPFSLLIRLFANITAGHIIILSLVSIIFIMKTWVAVPLSGVFVVFMSFIELLVAAIQAYIFTLLSALYIGMAVVEPEEGH